MRKPMRDFFQPPNRGPRGVERTQLHVDLTSAERDMLVKLTHRMKLSATDVLRTLILMAKSAGLPTTPAKKAKP